MLARLRSETPDVDTIPSIKYIDNLKKNPLEREVGAMDRLYWDTYVEDHGGLSHFIDSTVSFLHIYFGEVREAVAHSDDISRFGRVIYNEGAWDKEKFTDMKDIVTRKDHYEVVSEVQLRIEKYRCTKIDMGFMGRWKNPYQIADTHLPTGVTVTYEMREGLCFFQSVFFNPDTWFSLECKPLFKTDPVVEKEPHGSWNMNAVGLIAAKNEKCAANRRALFNMIADFVKDFNPAFSGLGRSQFYFNSKTRTAYVENPEAKTNPLLLPLVYYHGDTGGVLFSDSTPLPDDKYRTSLVKDRKIAYEKSHFDFF
ncbi:MAG: hypothetical protein AB1742_16385 [bacterium]